jgi:predicted ferric reductase
MSNTLLTIARIAGLLAMVIILFQLLSMGKGRTLDKLVKKLTLHLRGYGYGGQVVKLHRTAAFTLLPLIALHVSLVLYGRMIEYKDTLRVTLSDFYLDGRWGSVTGVGAALLIFALVMSMLFLRQRISYIVFKRSHLLMFIAPPLIFIHQIFFGLHFLSSAILCALWSTLFIVVFCDLLLWKMRSSKVLKC